MNKHLLCILSVLVSISTHATPAARGMGRAVAAARAVASSCRAAIAQRPPLATPSAVRPLAQHYALSRVQAGQIGQRRLSSTAVVEVPKKNYLPLGLAYAGAAVSVLGANTFYERQQKATKRTADCNRIADGILYTFKTADAKDLPRLVQQLMAEWDARYEGVDITVLQRLTLQGDPERNEMVVRLMVKEMFCYVDAGNNDYLEAALGNPGPLVIAQTIEELGAMGDNEYIQVFGEWAARQLGQL